MKYHLSIGNRTVMATLYLANMSPKGAKKDLEISEGSDGQTSPGYEIDLKNKLVELNAQNRLTPHEDFQSFQFPYVNKIEKASKDQDHILAVLLLNKPIYAPLNSFFIGSRLELGSESKSCRMAFSGRVLQTMKVNFEDKNEEATSAGNNYGSLDNVKLTKEKYRSGVLERFNNASTGIVKDMFGKGSDLSRFIGMKISFLEGKVEGTVLGAFGKNGKFKVNFGRNIDDEEQKSLLGEEGQLTFVKEIQLKR